MVTYYSKAWLEACRQRLNDSARHRRVGKRLNGTFVFRVWDGPDRKDRLAVWQFDAGECTGVTFEARPAPWRELRTASYDRGTVGRFSCPFDMMAKVNRGDISPVRAILSSSYRVDGNKLSMARLLPGINSWVEINATVPCRCDFTATDDDGNAVLPTEAARLSV